MDESEISLVRKGERYSFDTYAHHYPESLRDGVEILDQVGTNLGQSAGSPTALGM